MSFEQIPQIYLPSGILQMISSHLGKLHISELNSRSFVQIAMKGTLMGKNSKSSLLKDLCESRSTIRGYSQK